MPEDLRIPCDGRIPRRAAGMAADAPMAATTMHQASDAVRFGAWMEAQNVAAALAVIASRECPVSGEWVRAGAGYVGRILLGVTNGWVSETNPVPPEDVLEHFNEACNLESFVVPGSAQEVVDLMHERVVAQRAKHSSE